MHDTQVIRHPKALIWEAYQHVKTNGGAAGIDRQRLNASKNAWVTICTSSGIGCAPAAIFHLMRAVRKHCQTAWVLLYVERWLKALMQTMDGEFRARDRGTPQGCVVAPRTQKITTDAGSSGIRPLC